VSIWLSFGWKEQLCPSVVHSWERHSSTEVPHICFSSLCSSSRACRNAVKSQELWLRCNKLLFEDILLRLYALTWLRGTADQKLSSIKYRDSRIGKYEGRFAITTQGMLCFRNILFFTIKLILTRHLRSSGTLFETLVNRSSREISQKSRIVLFDRPYGTIVTGTPPDVEPVL
jgi:hypothetical protein